MSCSYQRISACLYNFQPSVTIYTSSALSKLSFTIHHQDAMTPMTNDQSEWTRILSLLWKLQKTPCCDFCCLVLWTRVLHRKIDGTTMNRNTNPKIPVIIMDLRLLKVEKKVIASFSGLLVVNLLGTCISDYNRIWLYHFRLWPEEVSTLTCHSTSLIGLYILQAIVGQRPWCWSFTYASPNQLTTFQTKNNNHERSSNFYTREKINLEA